MGQYEPQPSTAPPPYSKYDFPGADNIGKPGYLKSKWANILPLSMVKSMTQNRAPGEVVKITICCLVLFVFLLHFTVLITLPMEINGWAYWRIAGAIIFFIGIACCLCVFSMHVQFRGPRPNLFRLPMVPFLPCMTVIFNTILISQLSWMTWIRFIIWVGIAISFARGDFTNIEVSQTVHAESHIVRVDAEITLDLPSGMLTAYKYPIDNEVDSKTPLTVKSVGKVSNVPTFDIEIPKADAGKRFKFTVSSYFTGLLEPRPAEISQADSQFVELLVNVAHFSAYPTKKVSTTVTLGSGQILFFSEDITPVKKSTNKIIYGPFENVAPFEKRVAKFNYENTSPFLAITSLERSIEISHWGNIAIENQVSIRNYGAKLVGPFSRLDYQRGIGHKISIAGIKSILPASAKDIYYRDEIGNISTSNVKNLYSSVEVAIAPRFPLFGGWKTFFILGYNLPAYENLYRKGNKFALKMNFLDFLYDDILVDEMTLRIILPETVSNVRLEVPFEVEKLPDEVLKTYLDTSGRRVLVLHKKNLVEGHIQDFIVYYDFNMINMLREPAMLIAALMVFFTAIIIYVRLDFSISEDKMDELQQRVQVSVDEILSLQNKRSAIYQTYEDVVSSYKSSKDADRFKADYKRVEADYKHITQKISSLQTKLREIYSEGADKVGELQKLDQDYHALLTKGVSLAENVISGKISKPQYQTEDGSLSSKKSALVEKMESVAESL
ncbi:unnamed protein product [Rodentolepis nana]|uniref:Dolichyl-diphosphooligosaccharide--protein glycosyltransferase subunit 1 n=1 Tax=Rodentolepis nana TaxID=102285 RepID=A0A0R3TJE1_RODNA|nr:unnamed protein product [Rodentolepis nana]